MVEGFTIKNFFELGVYEGAKKQSKKSLKKQIMLGYEKVHQTYEEMKQNQWQLEVYSQLLLKGA